MVTHWKRGCPKISSSCRPPTTQIFTPAMFSTRSQDLSGRCLDISAASWLVRKHPFIDLEPRNLMEFSIWQGCSPNSTPLKTEDSASHHCVGCPRKTGTLSAAPGVEPKVPFRCSGRLFLYAFFNRFAHHRHLCQLLISASLTPGCLASIFGYPPPPPLLPANLPGHGRHRRLDGNGKSWSQRRRREIREAHSCDLSPTQSCDQKTCPNPINARIFCERRSKV